VIVDTSGAALRAMAQPEAHLLKPNLRELSQLVGQPREAEEQQEQAARELIETGHCHATELCRREDTERLYQRLCAA